MYGTSQQGEPENSGSQGGFSPYSSGSIPVGFYALQRENVFPERPREPECLFYMKTGDCKYGAVCRFHHPRERLIPGLDSVLSPMGLPLRPVSYLYCWSLFINLSYGFETSCVLLLHVSLSSLTWENLVASPILVMVSVILDHVASSTTLWVGIFTCNLSASSSADAPARRLLGSTLGAASLNLSSEGLVEAGSAKPRRLSLSEPRQMPSAEDNIDTEE
ncbi:hypothetical protein C1H46_007053 [Malus baccata]|uniref:C3H1-type domain-containing protein n=1 Tax=Malus baccata TaxID=106549 RepID=A0A540NA84_MALBA|nr:hypothetical protein C1H46_007053 [Malus baccata]